MLKNLIVFFLTLPLNAVAADRILDIGAVSAIPPYIDSTTNSGIEVDIVNEALKLKGYRTKLHYLPSSRIYQRVSSGDVDAGMTAVDNGESNNLFFSDSHVTYQNVVITLASKNTQIEDVTDLAGLKVVSFQNATKYLGQAFKNSVETMKTYSEKTDQTVPVAMLFLGRADAIVIDINIFNAVKSEIDKINTDSPITIHEIFPKNNMSVVFKDKTVRDDFNTGLAELKTSGEYQNILDKYTN